MPKRAQRRQSRQGGGAREGGSRRSPPRPASRGLLGSWAPSWLRGARTRSMGIGAVVVAAVVALVVVGILTSGGGDFVFSMYQGSTDQGNGELQGNDIAFSRLFPADKPVVLNFWAGLCPPCRAEMPGFQAVYNQFHDEFTLLGVDIGPFMGLGSNGDARRLLDELGVSYPVAYAHDRTPVAEYGIISMPTTLFFTADGKLFKKWEGFLEASRMSGMIQDLVAESASRTASLSPAVPPGPSSPSGEQAVVAGGQGT